MAAYKIRYTDEKGYGVFATRNIDAGAVILRDKRIMRINEGGQNRSLSHISEAFSELSPSDQKRYMRLYARPGKDGVKSIRQIYNTNCFSDEYDTSYMCFTISRINHACTPNAKSSDCGKNRELLSAIVPIAAGEEITISYRQDICWLMTRAQRQRLLQTWGFSCKCNACDRSERDIELSDIRRKIIWGLNWLTKFDGPVDYTHFRHLRSFASVEEADDRIGKKATVIIDNASKRVGHYLLLAYCLEAEGMERDMIADAYAGAAEAQLSEIEDDENSVLVLQCAQNVRDWTYKAMRYSAEYYGEGSHHCIKHHETWSRYQLVPRLKIALRTTDFLALGLLRDRPVTVEELASSFWHKVFHTRQEKDTLSESKVFALRFIFLPSGEAAVKCVDERECRDTIRKQCMNSKTRARGEDAMQAVMREYQIEAKRKEKEQKMKSHIRPIRNRRMLRH